MKQLTKEETYIFTLLCIASDKDGTVDMAHFRSMAGNRDIDALVSCGLLKVEGGQYLINDYAALSKVMVHVRESLPTR